MNKLFLASGAVLCALAGCSGSSGGTPNVNPLFNPPQGIVAKDVEGTSTTNYTLFAGGEVVGDYTLSGVKKVFFAPFLTATPVPLKSTTGDIFNGRSIARGVSTANGNSNKTFVWTTATADPLELVVPAGFTTDSAVGITGDSTVVGNALNGANSTPYRWSYPYGLGQTMQLPADGTGGSMLAVLDDNRSVGLVKTGTGTFPAFWQTVSGAPTYFVRPATATTFTEGNAAGNGRAVFTATIGGNAMPVFYASPTSNPAILALPSGFSSGHATGVNRASNVVGWVGSGGSQRAVIWISGVVYDLNTLIPAGFGHVLVQPLSITDDNVITVMADNGLTYLVSAS